MLFRSYGVWNLEESLEMSKARKQSTEAAVREIRRKTRRKFAPEQMIRIVLEGLRGEQSISELCRSAVVACCLVGNSREFVGGAL